MNPAQNSGPSTASCPTSLGELATGWDPGGIVIRSEQRRKETAKRQAAKARELRSTMRRRKKATQWAEKLAACLVAAGMMREARIVRHKPQIAWNAPKSLSKPDTSTMPSRPVTKNPGNV